MALKMNQMRCPNCGANLEFEGNRDQLFCSYCGTKIVITDENRHEIVHRYIDEAAIAKEQRKLREAELDDKFWEREDNQQMKILIGLVLFFLIYVIIAIIVW